MIEYLKGEIAELTPATAIIECGGVGYETSITLNTYSALQDKKNVKVYIYEVIREDTHQLFGFSHKEERELFLLLISVSGIGGNTARTILSAFTVNELCEAIFTGNEAAIKSVNFSCCSYPYRVLAATQHAPFFRHLLSMNYAKQLPAAMKEP